MNLADFGTRGNVKAEEIGEGSVYQEGMPWMAGPIEEWPVKQKIEPPPAEELRKGDSGHREQRDHCGRALHQI
jgi:hypothetical protein